MSVYIDNEQLIVSANYRWYAQYETKDKLDKLFKNNHFKKTKTLNKPNFIFVPHAGLIYSGLCATTAYQYITDHSYKTIILLCTFHSKSNDIYLPSFTEINIENYGKIEIDGQLVNKLKSFAKEDDTPFIVEHSFHNQLPFLLLMKEKFKIVPIIVGKNDNVFVTELYKLIHDDVLVICNSDLSHVNGHFNQKISEPYIQNKIREFDTKITTALCDYKNRHDFDDVSACGKPVIKLFISLLNLLNYSLYSRLTCYHTSKQLKAINKHGQVGYVKDMEYNNDSCVSYASIIYTTTPYINKSMEREMTNLLTRYEEIVLVKYAIDSIKSNFLKNVYIEPIYFQALTEKRDVFITIEEHNGKLRGCIGTLNSDDTIKFNVNKYAIETAYNDSRFSPMASDEVFGDKYRYKVSLLAKLKPITLEEYKGPKFDIENDGIYLKKGNRSAFFLNSVARDHGYGKIKLLEQLCYKAGEEEKCYEDASLSYNEGYEFQF